MRALTGATAADELLRLRLQTARQRMAEYDRKENRVGLKGDQAA
jgi:hypothetical protein